MKLARRTADRPLISLVPMVDVMLILLVFFMVTSTYLNLDMIPFVDRSDEQPPTAAAAAVAPGDATTLLVRISADGRTFLAGEALDASALQAAVSDRLADNPLLSVVLLPSTQARTQDLVTAMDLLTTAGATRLRLMQLEPVE